MDSEEVDNEAQRRGVRPLLSLALIFAPAQARTFIAFILPPARPHAKGYDLQSLQR